jgi:ornithine--oxo-acid transaminase
LAAAVGIAALEVLKEEKMTENAQKLGEKLRKALNEMKPSWVTTIRGRGLLNAIVIDEKFDKTAWQICMRLRQKGLLCKPTHNTTIRLVRNFREIYSLVEFLTRSTGSSFSNDRGTDG